MQEISRWSGDDRFYQTSLSDQKTRLCHLTVEKYSEDQQEQEIWAWRVWPVIALRQGPGLDRHGLSVSRDGAKRAAARAARGLAPGLSRVHVLLTPPRVTRMVPGQQKVTGAGKIVTIHILQRVRDERMAAEAGNEHDIGNSFAA